MVRAPRALTVNAINRLYTCTRYVAVVGIHHAAPRSISAQSFNYSTAVN